MELLLNIKLSLLLNQVLDLWQPLCYKSIYKCKH